jgi:hypothetical protein
VTRHYQSADYQRPPDVSMRMTMPTSSGVTRDLVLAMVAVAVAANVTVGSQEQAQDPATTAVVERAGRYVEAYEQAFSAIVSEERQVQRLVRPDGRVRKLRELTSDFLLVKTSPSGAQAFRDVIDVDGKPVRNREDRLRQLFLEQPKTAVEQARAIARESERHNIGMQRTGNSPLLPLRFLRPAIASGFRFTLTGDSLGFQEFRSPSVLGQRSRDTRYDLMSHGSFAIEPESGRVLAADFTAVGPPPTYGASLAVRFGQDAKLELLVPIDVKERYWTPHKPNDDRLEVDSTYTNFRRFQVSVGEQAKSPE